MVTFANFFFVLSAFGVTVMVVVLGMVIAGWAA
jgi:hypothetical protein